MAGNTSRIDLATLRAQWASHSSYYAICTAWTITKDQLVRLRNVLPLPLRTDRRLRYRPPASEKPTPAEIAASEATLSLAPMVAARATCVTAHWTEDIRASRQVTKPVGFAVRPASRQVTKPVGFAVRPVPMPDELRNTFDDLNREGLR